MRVFLVTTTIVLTATSRLLLTENLIPGRKEKFIHQVDHSNGDGNKNEYVLYQGIHYCKDREIRGMGLYSDAVTQ